MIQFKIQFKTKSKIFIQKNIHSIESKIFKKIFIQKKEENYSIFKNSPPNMPKKLGQQKVECLLTSIKKLELQKTHGTF